MGTYFVTRHAGAREWASRRGIKVDQMVDHMTQDHIASLNAGDVIIGVLPINLAAQVCARGGRYLHLSMEVPPSLRGKELSADEMEALGASIQEYKITLL